MPLNYTQVILFDHKIILKNIYNVIGKYIVKIKFIKKKIILVF